MHPKEFRKTKNGTGHFTHQSLSNSEIYIGIDFTNNEKINSIIDNTKNKCYILYPGQDSIKLNEEPLKTQKNIVLFILDSTWACSKKMLRVNKRLRELQKISFVSTKQSEFKIKTQPNSYCLSTIESTKHVLELLNTYKLENIEKEELDLFTKPFEKMVDFQINCAQKIKNSRFK